MVVYHLVLTILPKLILLIILQLKLILFLRIVYLSSVFLRQGYRIEIYHLIIIIVMVFSDSSTTISFNIITFMSLRPFCILIQNLQRFILKTHNFTLRVLV